MSPYYIAVIFGDERMECHRVYAHNQREAVATVICFYADCTLMGILFVENETEQHVPSH